MGNDIVQDKRLYNNIKYGKYVELTVKTYNNNRENEDSVVKLNSFDHYNELLAIAMNGVYFDGTKYYWKVVK